MSDLGEEWGKAMGLDKLSAPSLEEMQHWTGVLGRAQQLLMEQATEMALRNTTAKPGMAAFPVTMLSTPIKPMPMPDPARLAGAQSDFWSESIALWQRLIMPGQQATGDTAADKDRRFSAAQWRDNPIFDTIRQCYLLLCDHMLRSVDALEALDPKQREQIRFMVQSLNDAMAPSNFPLTNPVVLERMIESRGESMLKGLERMLADLSRGQLTHSPNDAFVLGRDLAATPGKVIKETPLYQLIHYQPTTETVQATPLLIFPPWINRFYILDLKPQNSFVRWAVEQGLSVFVVSWKSADASMVDTTMDDYVLKGQIDAIDTVRDVLGVESVHTIGYCVAGTALSMTLAYLAATGGADKVASATFFTAQVDFTEAGDLTMFVDDEQIEMVSSLSAESGILDGRIMAATFNILRGRDLIWNYVVNNYLLGEDYRPFDLLHWNGDVTNLPGAWHRKYLEQLYRDNLLVKRGGVSIAGVPIDLTTIKTPAYVQAGREDHIAPPQSVWKIMHHFAGPVKFLLAGSGHIAGVVNPPSAGKYQYWTNNRKVKTLDSFVAGAKETAGSWWPDWIDWISARSGGMVPVEGARVPGEGALAAIEDAPGRYVRTR